MCKQPFLPTAMRVFNQALAVHIIHILVGRPGTLYCKF